MYILQSLEFDGIMSDERSVIYMTETYKYNPKTYRYQYEKEKLKRIPLDLQVTEYDRIKTHSAELGIGAATYIKGLIWADLDKPSIRLRDVVPDELYQEFMRVTTAKNADLSSIFTKALQGYISKNQGI